MGSKLLKKIKIDGGFDFRNVISSSNYKYD